MAGLPAMATKLIMVKSGSEASDLDIAHLKSIGDQSTEADEIDVTTLDSPNRAKEFIQGAKDAGTMDFVINDMFDGQVGHWRSPSLESCLPRWQRRFCVQWVH